MENSTPSDDLASYEGKYPKDLFNKTVSGQAVAFGRIFKANLPAGMAALAPRS